MFKTTSSLLDGLLSANSRACIDASRVTMARLHALPDRFLGRELLRLARAARTQVLVTDAYMADPQYGTYNVALLWHVLPEMAARLGETSFELNERKDPWMAAKTGADFRECVSSYITHNDLGHRYGYKGDQAEPNPCYLLGHEPCNGNPIAIALDRLCPPFDTSADDAARRIREAGRCRFGNDAVVNAWSPAFQDYPRSRRA